MYFQLSLVLPMRINEDYPFMEKNSHIVIVTCRRYDFYTVMNAFLLISILGVKTLNVQKCIFTSNEVYIGINFMRIPNLKLT